jgi:hypothetical protein
MNITNHVIACNVMSSCRLWAACVEKEYRPFRSTLINSRVFACIVPTIFGVSEVLPGIDVPG